MRCAVIDFDGTLAAFTNGPEGFFGIFEKQGVPAKIIKENYDAVRDSKGFSIENLYDALSKKGFSLNKNILGGGCEEWMRSD